MINKEAFDKMKDGVVLLNFARDLLVDEDALIEAVESGKVKKYVTDFANETVAGREGILVTPHLGASTEESEENCAEMAVRRSAITLRMVISKIQLIIRTVIWVPVWLSKNLSCAQQHTEYDQSGYQDPWI